MSRVLLLIFLLLSGCRAEPPAPGLQDDLGRTVPVQPPVRRVLTLAPNLTEIVFAAGGGDRLVGVSTADDYPPAINTLPRFSALPLNVEAILALRPELVLANATVNRPADADRLQELGIPVYFFRFQTLADVPRAIRKIGMLLGTERVAEEAARTFEATVARIRAHTAGRPRPKVLLLIGVETLYSFGAPDYVHELVEVTGGESVTRHFPQAGIVLNDEFVLRANPDVVIILSDDPTAPERLLQYHPVFRHLKAVREGKVYTIHPSLIVRPGPRLVEGMRELARYLHPEVEL